MMMTIGSRLHSPSISLYTLYFPFTTSSSQAIVIASNGARERVGRSPSPLKRNGALGHKRSKSLDAASHDRRAPPRDTRILMKERQYRSSSLDDLFAADQNGGRASYVNDRRMMKLNANGNGYAFANPYARKALLADGSDQRKDIYLKYHDSYL